MAMIALWATALSAQTRQGYHIEGQVTGVPDNTVLYLRLVEAQKNIDSTRIDKGHFAFKGNGVSKPVWALVNVKGRFLSLCDFYLENGNISIKGGEYSAKATGTPTNEQYLIYNRDINSYNNELYSLNVKISTSADKEVADSLRAVQKQKELEMKAKEIEFVKTYPDSPVSLRIVSYRSSSVPSAQIKELISYLSPAQQATPEIEKLRKYAENLSRTEPGAPAADFTLTDAEGKTFSLSEEKGRYVLLDFWASWCAPCRASFPLIASLQKKYADERFTLIGVSVDKKEEAWHKALKEENATWRMVCDPKGSVAHGYAVSTIPLLVLVGPDGKIVGRFNKGNIEAELERIFGK